MMKHCFGQCTGLGSKIADALPTGIGKHLIISFFRQGGGGPVNA
jgi:hypothetical protein